MQENVIGAHLLLPRKLNQDILEITRKYKEHDLRSENIPLHITLGFAVIPVEKFKDICQAIKELAISRVHISLQEICNSEFVPEKTFSSQAVLHKSKRIILLHELVIDILNHHRSNQSVRLKDRKKIANGEISKNTYKHIKKYGYRHSMQFYRPHITLGLYKSDAKLYNSTGKYYKDYLNFLVGRKFYSQEIEVVSCAEYFRKTNSDDEVRLESTGKYDVIRRIIK